MSLIAQLDAALARYARRSRYSGLPQSDRMSRQVYSRLLTGRFDHRIRYQKVRHEIEKAASETDANPSDAQKESGNYKKGKVRIHGMQIAIENPKGSIRSGDGWSVEMLCHYGYILLTESEADGDHVDVFIGPHPESESIFVIDQVTADGKFDEHKTMLGWTNKDDARDAYLSAYSDGWKVGPITAMTVEQFKEWLKDGDTGNPIEKQVSRYNKRIVRISAPHYSHWYMESWMDEKTALMNEFNNEIHRRIGDQQRVARYARRFQTEIDRYVGKFVESEHPRASDGRFGTKAGSSGKSDDKPREKSAPSADKPKWRTDSPTPDFTAIHKAFPPVNADAVETKQKYMLADGSFTPERKRLHKEIVSGILKGVKRVKNPHVMMMGGGTASGKSRLIDDGHVMYPDGSAMIDSDKIKGLIPEYQEMLRKDDRGAAFSHEESSAISKLATAQALEMGANVVMDGTGDNSYEKLASKVAKWRKAGHRVVAHYVTVDTDEAIRRSAKRAEKKGRKVPSSVIREIHAGVSAVFPQAIENGLFDEFSLWDTGTEGGTTLVVSGKGKNLTVHDAEAYKRFLAKAES